MKVIGLDNREYTLDLHGKEVTSKLNKSKYHLQARDMIKRVFPSLRLVEEVHLPGCKTSMYLDFFIPLMRIGVEVQGEQHYKFIQYFHKDKIAFMQAKMRDGQKRTWCETNDITLIELPFNETEQEWEGRLKNVFRS